jgi:hypothetical protein
MPENHVNLVADYGIKYLTVGTLAKSLHNGKHSS